MQVAAVGLDEALFKLLAGYGYSELRVLPTGEVAGLRNFLFTFGLVVGLDRAGYRTRYCFEHRADALSALEGWDGQGDPAGPWIKRKGRDAEYLNPAIGEL